jgi:hypothetical protein
MAAELHVMRETNLHNVAATLRTIADGIEAGEYGQATGCVLVLEADALDVFYSGTGEAGPRTVLLLATAQAKIVNSVLEVVQA